MKIIKHKYEKETGLNAIGDHYLQWLENKLMNNEVLVYCEYESKGYEDERPPSLQLVNRFSVESYTKIMINEGYNNFKCFWIVQEIDMKPETGILNYKIDY